MAEELGLRRILGGEFNTLWWVDESSDRDVLRRYFTALARADEALDARSRALPAAVEEMHSAGVRGPAVAGRPVGRR